MPMVKMVARGFTAAADAYLTPHIMRYLATFMAGFDAGLNDVQVGVGGQGLRQVLAGQCVQQHAGGGCFMPQCAAMAVCVHAGMSQALFPRPVRPALSVYCCTAYCLRR